MIDILELTKELRNIVNHFGHGVAVDVEKGPSHGNYKYRVSMRRNGNLYCQSDFYSREYFLMSSFINNNVVDYTVKPKWRKEHDHNSPLDVYIKGLIDYRNYVLKYHIPGIWDDLYKRVGDITDDKLVALKLFTDDIKTEYDAWKKSVEFGLPQVINRTKTLNHVDLNTSHYEYVEYVKSKIEKRENFSCRWDIRNLKAGRYIRMARKIIIVGKQEETYRVWMVIENGKFVDGIYSLLDGNHAVIAEDCNMLDFSQVEDAERCDEE